MTVGQGFVGERMMPGWLFPPACPCDIAANGGVEERLQWLSEEFDDHAFNGRPIVLPTANICIKSPTRHLSRRNFDRANEQE